MKIQKFKLFILVCALSLNGCTKSNSEIDNEIIDGGSCCSTTGPVVIYKTKKDYFDKISIRLSDDKSKVLSFPGVSNTANHYPLELANGYLQKRMTGNAFLSITIKEYGLLKSEPTTEKLLQMVIDNDPFTEYYECCDLCIYDTAGINKLIKENNLSNCEG